MTRRQLSESRFRGTPGTRGELGRLADITVLSANPIEASPNALLEIRADMTIVDNVVVWDRPDSVAQ